MINLFNLFSGKNRKGNSNELMISDKSSYRKLDDSKNRVDTINKVYNDTIINTNIVNHENETYEDKANKLEKVVSDCSKGYNILNKEGNKEKVDYFLKKTVKKNLAIFLIEDSAEVFKYNEYISKIFEANVSNSLVCIVHYGKNIESSEILNSKLVDLEKLYCKNSFENDACLYDAINTVTQIIKYNQIKTFEEEKERYIVSSFSVIGIGRCIDNCSTSNISNAFDNFFYLTRRFKANTKYFCLSEENFIDAAYMGFHSIGAINRKY